MIPLPARCFISHAYQDAAARDRLISTLPDIDALVFPPITVKPDEFVSNRLIDALLGCDGLIYLSGGRSASSFWVAFERDYALRAGKQVFVADPETLEVVRDTCGPLDLATFASYHHEADRTRVQEIADFLASERYFDLTMDAMPNELQQSIIERATRGYVIVFWSRQASESLWVKEELKAAAAGISTWNDRVLFALLDDFPLPDQEFWMKFQDPAIQVYGDAARPAHHRWDDLVLRLYWLIYRKTKQANPGA